MSRCQCGADWSKYDPDDIEAEPPCFCDLSPAFDWETNQIEGGREMASSPEQEIPQEIVWKMHRVLRGQLGNPHPNYEDIEIALAAVLPDLQRPLLEEIAKLKGERDAYVERLGEVNVERQRQEVRAIEAERERDQAREAIRANGDLALQMIAERDARPDLTPADTRALLDGWMAHSNLPFCPDPECDAKGCIEARRMRDEIKRKLERSLDAHKP